MTFNDFTKEQRTTIAEFVYSYDQDILIKNDALNLVDLFVQKNMVDERHASELKRQINQHEFVLEELIEILFTSVEEDDGKKIMNEYFNK